MWLLGKSGWWTWTFTATPAKMIGAVALTRCSFRRWRMLRLPRPMSVTCPTKILNRPMAISRWSLSTASMNSIAGFVSRQRALRRLRPIRLPYWKRIWHIGWAWMPKKTALQSKRKFGRRFRMRLTWWNSSSMRALRSFRGKLSAKCFRAPAKILARVIRGFSAVALHLCDSRSTGLFPQGISSLSGRMRACSLGKRKRIRWICVRKRLAGRVTILRLTRIAIPSCASWWALPKASTSAMSTGTWKKTKNFSRLRWLGTCNSLLAKAPARIVPLLRNARFRWTKPVPMKNFSRSVRFVISWTESL